MSRKDWTSKEIEKLRSLRESGLTLDQIAVKLGRSAMSVYYACRSNEIDKGWRYDKWIALYNRDPSPTRAARHFGCSVAHASKTKMVLLRMGWEFDKRFRRERKYMSKQWPKFVTTKYKEIGYTHTDRREWRFVDLNCPSSTENKEGPSLIGRPYRSEFELLADLDDYAERFGCDGVEVIPVETQPELDSIIRIMQSLSRRCEATKEAKEHDSRSFWFWHVAMTYIDQAVAHLTKQKGV